MIYDYSKLIGRIIEKYSSQSNFANAMNLSEHSISLKLNCKVGWKQREISEACNLLKIPVKEISDYFFKEKVQN